MQLSGGGMALLRSFCTFTFDCTIWETGMR